MTETNVGVHYSKDKPHTGNFKGATHPTMDGYVVRPPAHKQSNNKRRNTFDSVLPIKSIPAAVYENNKLAQKTRIPAA